MPGAGPARNGIPWAKVLDGMPYTTACHLAVLAALQPPVLGEPGRPVVISGSTSVGEVQLAGAHVAMRSAHGIEAWTKVIQAPEDQEDWQPKDIGPRRAEKLDPEHLYLQMDVSMLFGAVRIGRQAVVGIDWLEQSDERVRNCWYASDPGPWKAEVASWVDGSDWLDTGYGGWELRALPDGGTAVYYQLWTGSEVLLPRVQGWVMSRTLPALMQAFEARAGVVAGELKGT